MTILEAKGISKQFPGVKALDNVTFSVEEGDMVALVGENGAGKSTLMKIVSGYYPHSSYDGELWVKGEKVNFSKPLDAERVGLEMIYQEINMHLDLTVAENIFLGKWPKKNKCGLVDWKKMVSESYNYLEMVGAQFKPTDLMRSLSASRQQQVAIARSLFREPSILILDEPSSVLTDKEADHLFSILDNLNREKHLTVILITHKMEEVFANTRKIVTLRDGRTIGSHNTDDVDKAFIVKEMVGRSINKFFFKEIVNPKDTVLDVHNVSVPHPYIKGKNLLDNVSFSVRSGEILGIAGIVGAGRSELVNAVFGKDKITSGNILVEGMPIQRNDQKESVKSGIGLITEDRKKDGFISVLDIKSNMTLASLEKFNTAGFIQQIREERETRVLFDSLRVKAKGLETPMGELSGGNQQKVVIAKWLMAGSRILLLDEPTRGVDIGAKEEIYHLIGKFVKDGMAVVLISSELPELMALSDRIIVLRDGDISAEIQRADFSSERIMENAV